MGTVGCVAESASRRRFAHFLPDVGPRWNPGEACWKEAAELERWFSGPEGPQAQFAGRVLPFDEKAGLLWARLMAEGAARGGRAAPSI